MPLLRSLPVCLLQRQSQQAMQSRQSAARLHHHCQTSHCILRSRITLSLLETKIFANHVMPNRWDDWVPQDRVRKFTDENKELAAQLHTQMRNLQRQSKREPKGGKGTRANGSEMGSGRGSEERHPSLAAQGPRSRGRNRDYDLEPVSLMFSLLLLLLFCVSVIVCCEATERPTSCPAPSLLVYSLFWFRPNSPSGTLKIPLRPLTGFLICE